MEENLRDSLFLLDIKHKPEEPQDDGNLLIFIKDADGLPRFPAVVVFPELDLLQQHPLCELLFQFPLVSFSIA